MQNTAEVMSSRNAQLIFLYEECKRGNLDGVDEFLRWNEENMSAIRECNAIVTRCKHSYDKLYHVKLLLLASHILLYLHPELSHGINMGGPSLSTEISTQIRPSFVIRDTLTLLSIFTAAYSSSFIDHFTLLSEFRDVSLGKYRDIIDISRKIKRGFSLEILRKAINSFLGLNVKFYMGKMLMNAILVGYIQYGLYRFFAGPLPRCFLALSFVEMLNFHLHQYALE